MFCHKKVLVFLIIPYFKCSISIIVNSSSDGPIFFSLWYRNIERLILLQCIRPDKLIYEIRQFIGENLGEEFVSAPAFDLSTSFADSDRYKPLILILAPGSDPLSAIKAFTPDDPKNRPVSSTFVSLGQGQP